MESLKHVDQDSLVLIKGSKRIALALLKDQLGNCLKMACCLWLFT